MALPPPGFRVTFAQRTEDLLDALWDEVRQPAAPDPAWRECIVVQNRGMARWLELQLSARAGVWANAWFPFVEAFAFRLWRDVVRPGRRARRGAYDRAALPWAVAAVLPELLDRPPFEPLRSWVGPERAPERVLELARAIGPVLDGYLLYRPDLLQAWEDDPPALLTADLPPAAAEDAAWQAELWRAVAARAGPDAVHPARRAEELVAALETGAAADRLGSLRRVSVFGLSALSPTYVRILAALGRHVPVRLYALAAAPERAVARVEAGATAPGAGALSLHPAPPADLTPRLMPSGAGQPLVAGQAAAAHAFQLLAGLAGARPRALAAPAPPPAARAAGAPSALALLQADLLADRPPTPGPAAFQALAAGRDLSIGLHSCHGALREVEVLKDQLLSAFDELPDLAPHDVVVMVPEVEEYAPCFEAVFGAGRAHGTHLPFRVADRAASAERPAARAFYQALRALRGRATAPDVLDLLALEPLRRARGLTDAAVETLHGWIHDAGIRWGLDGRHRADVGQPELEANTWRWGLGRLLLGWAAPGDGRHRLNGLLPYAPAGAEPALAGALADFVAVLEHWRARLAPARRDLDGWAEELAAFAAELFGDGPEAADERLLVETALGLMADVARGGGYAGAVGLDTVTDLVAERLAEEPMPRGFLEGAVTVCAPVPMRAIPFRVVALAGMNDGAFPGTDRPPGFDLAARAPRLGDNPRREADRLLFLEALLCARERLIITWTGRDPRTDAGRPPSVVVSELLDVLAAMGRATPGAAVEELVRCHPLHPFGACYFQPGQRRFFSFCAAYAGTAGRAAAERRELPPLVREELPPTAAQAERAPVPLAALARFPESPARRLVHDRLGVTLPERGALLADREPMGLAGLERYQVGQAVLAARLEGAAPEEAAAVARAQGRLPLGTPGLLAAAPVQAVVERLLELRGLLVGAAETRAVTVDIRLGDGDWRVTGALCGLCPAGSVEVGFGALDTRRLLRAWVRHLVLNVALDAGQLEGCPAVSWLIGRAVSSRRQVTVLCLGPVPEAPAVLGRFVDWWHEAETGLVPFFPGAARAYTAALAKAGQGAGAGLEAATEQEALRKAADAFGAGRREQGASQQSYGSVDLDDEYLAAALGEALPWDADGAVRDAALVERFRQLAHLVFQPLDLACREAHDEEAPALIQSARSERSGPDS